MNWHALFVRSRHEKSVGAQLEAKNQEVFVPLYSRKQRWADRWKLVELPLFPSYVFCRFDSSRRSSVLATSGVIDVVRSGSEPARIEASQIEAIQRVVKSPLATEPHAGLVGGQTVTMCDGPLKGLAGTLTEVRKDLRLVVSVELLRRSVLIEIDQDWVLPCDLSTQAYSKVYTAEVAKKIA